MGKYSISERVTAKLEDDHHCSAIGALVQIGSIKTHNVWMAQFSRTKIRGSFAIKLIGSRYTIVFQLHVEQAKTFPALDAMQNLAQDTTHDS